jgi:hypothetical protein
MRDPDKNPGYIPCPDYELHGCFGCMEKENKEGIWLMGEIERSKK